MKQVLCIGDAVVPKYDPEHDVMTVYDLKDNYTTALCNWLVGHKMFKETWDVRDLVRVERSARRSA